MAVTPQYADPANESGEPHAPLYWVEDYSEDEQLQITSFGGEPYRRQTDTALPPDPGSPGWDPSQGTGEAPPVESLGWSQVDPGIVWTDIDPSIPWIGDTAVADDVTLGWVTTLAAPMSSGAFAGPYPDGISIFAMTAVQATADGGWPLGAASQVMTIKTAPDQSSQFWFRNTSGSSDAYYREVGVSWAGPWVQIAGQTQVAQILTTPLASSALASAYPTGFTLFYLTAAQATADAGWPAAVAGTVFTLTSSSGQAAQFWFQSSATAPNVYYRSLSGTGISAWQQFIGGSIYAQVPSVPTASSAGSGSYPTGFSTFAVSLSQSQDDGGWPTTGSFNVMTVKATTTASQFAFQSAAPYGVWFRAIFSAANSGTPWVQIAGAPVYAQVIATLNSGDFLAAYPLGISTFAITTAEATADGNWPVTTSSQVVTFKSASDRAFQFWSRNSTTFTELWHRQLGAAANSPWVQITGAQQYRAQNSTTTQNITSGVWTLLSVTGDEAGATSTGGDIVKSGNGMKVNRAGLYEVSILVTWNGGQTTGSPVIGLSDLAASGAEGFYRQQVSASPASTALVQSAMFLRHMDAGDTVGIWALQSSGSTQGVGNRRLVVRRLSD